MSLKSSLYGLLGIVLAMALLLAMYGPVAAEEQPPEAVVMLAIPADDMELVQGFVMHILETYGAFTKVYLVLPGEEQVFWLNPPEGTEDAEPTDE